MFSENRIPHDPGPQGKKSRQVCGLLMVDRVLHARVTNLNRRSTVLGFFQDSRGGGR